MYTSALNIDLELVAAFIDGRVSGEERARAVRLVSESDEALELFAHVLRVIVVPIATARRWRWTAAMPIAAVVVLGAALVPRLIGRQQRSPTLQYAAALSRSAASAGAFDAGWEQRGWSATRGGSPLEARRLGHGRSSSELGPTFRLGVRSIDLQVALGHGDTQVARRLTSEIIDDLTAIRFSELVAVNYTGLRSGLSTVAIERSLDRASSAEGELRAVLDSSTFTFGQWVAAAELAARTHDARFFESDLAHHGLQSAIATGSVSAEDADSIRSIERLLKQGPTERVLDQVREILQTIIRHRGS